MAVMEKMKAGLRKGINWKKSMGIEHKVAQIIADSEREAVEFNQDHAQSTLDYLDSRMGKASSWLLKRLPLLSHPVGAKCKPVDYNKKMVKIAADFGLKFDLVDPETEERFYPPTTQIFTKTGYHSNLVKYWEDDCNIVNGPFTKISWEPINLTSLPQLKRYLKLNDWIPDEFTETGEPKVTATSLANFKHPAIGKALSDYLIMSARRRTVQNPDKEDKGWMNNLREDGRIPSFNNPQATPTGRSRHRLLVNVPGVDSEYGSLMRDCFTTKSAPTSDWEFERITRDKRGRALNEEGGVAKKGDKIARHVVKVENQYAMVGTDASGLEMRMLASEMGDPELIDIILNDDIHTHIWKIIDDLSGSRGNTKGIEYCLPLDTTEVLTENGWEPLGDIKVGQKVYGLDESKDLVYTTVRGTSYIPAAKVIEMSNGPWSIESTQDHRWLGYQTNYKRNDPKPVFKYFTTNHIFRTDMSCTIQDVPKVPHLFEDSENYDIGRGIGYLVLMGTTNVGERIKVKITEQSLASWKKVAFVLDYDLDSILISRMDSRRLARNLGCRLHYNFFGSLLKELPTLDHSLVAGIASVLEDNPPTLDLSKDRIDVLHLAAFLTGKRYAIDNIHPGHKSIVRIGEINSHSLDKSKGRHVDVGCLQTCTGNFIIRQKGTITVTGNCLIYGGGDRKLGSLADIGRDIIGEHELKDLGWKKTKKAWIKGEIEQETFFDAQSYELGKVLRARLMSGLPALDEAIKRNKDHVNKHGYLIGIDGRKLQARSAHSALNLKLQSSGALVMKKSLINYHKHLQSHKVDGKIVIFYHDEFQTEVHPDQRFLAGELAVRAIREAGEYFKLPCELDGQAVIGLTWGDTH